MIFEDKETITSKENIIYFDNIKYGLDHYANEIVVMDEKKAFSFFKDELLKAELGSVYVDFYYGRLEKASRDIIDKELTEPEKHYIQSMIKEGEIIYPADETLLEIVTKLNASGTLFSTIYFTGESKHRSTWWGNYNQEYIVFREKQK